jgi:hypothetical protein
MSTNSLNKIQIHKKTYGIIGCFLVLTVPYFVMIINRGNSLETAQSLCPFKMLTGFPCPGCGITKSIINCYEGNFLKAIEQHLFGPIVILFAAFMILWLLVEIWTKKEFLNQYFYNKKIGYTTGICLGVYQLVRVVVFVLDNSYDDILKQSIWK